jgi:hypothetical protein
MARTVEDVLARRTRALFDARAAIGWHETARLLRELNRDDGWQTHSGARVSVWPADTSSARRYDACR